MAVTILIFEDNPDLRESLAALLKLDSHFEVLGTYGDSMEVESLVEAYQPDVILMDIDMPGRNGIEAVKLIRKTNKKVKIIMLTIFDDNTHVFEALYSGADGYLLKKSAAEKLLASIQEVVAGGAPMSPAIARMVIENMQAGAEQTANSYQLTNREKEILSLLSKGNSFKMIAADLSLSIDTVRTHIKHIYEKLHVQSQIEAVIKAINEKLV